VFFWLCLSQRVRQEAPRKHIEKRVARLPLIDPETTTGDIRASFDRMPVKLNIFRMMAHAEANMIPAMRLGNSILHRQKLSAVNRELLILQVAQLEHGAYEWRQHVPIALGVGVTQRQVDCLERAAYDDGAFSDAERARKAGLILRLGGCVA
jgi:alkylhydroperoxidase family enzyme